MSSVLHSKLHSFLIQKDLISVYVSVVKQNTGHHSWSANACCYDVDASVRLFLRGAYIKGVHAVWSDSSYL